jgi:hypothetical protein
MEQLPNIVDRLQRIEELLHQLVERETAKEWYTTEEVAKKLAARNSRSANGAV